MRKLKIELDCGQIITVHPPTVKQYYKDRGNIKSDEDLFAHIADVYSRNDEGIVFTGDDVLEKFTTDDFDFYTNGYLKWVKNVKENDPN